MKALFDMGRDEILALSPREVYRPLSAQEVVHMAAVLDAFWSYDYQEAAKGNVGMHAILKSGLHSDGFFSSKILLAHENILYLIADQMVRWIQAQFPEKMPNYVLGIPDGATTLGEAVAKLLGIPTASAKKTEEGIALETQIPDGAALLIVEDFCTRATGFIQTVRGIREKNPRIQLLPFYPVIVNRGDLRAVSVPGIERPFTILAMAEERIKDWNPDEDAGGCALCKLGSKPIKPKITDENWQLLTNSQKL